MKITRVAVIPDIHAPKHHKKSVDAVFEFLKFYKPKLCIQLGDWCDYSSLSRFAMLKEDELVGLRQEEGEANDLLDMFMTMDFFGNGFFTAHPIPIIKGQFCKMGKVWG